LPAGWPAVLTQDPCCLEDVKRSWEK